MFNIVSRPLLFAVATALTVGIAAGPAAAGETQRRSTEVRYNDLDLASADGAARLDRRVRAAARDVCGEADIRDLVAQRAISACFTEAMNSAAPQVRLALESARSGERMAQNSVSIRAAR